MRALAAAVTLLALAAVPPAAAVEPTGLLCNVAGFLDDVAPPEERRGTVVIHGGPLVVTGLAGGAPARLTCSLQENGWRHADPDLVTVTSVATPGVVTLPPTPAPYATDAWAYLVTCTRVEVEGGATYYLDAERDEWVTDPSVSCVAPSYDPPVLDLLGYLDGVFVEHVDPVVCPVLAARAPGAGPVVVEPDGDVSLPAWDPAWDCPPYDDGTP